MLEVTLATDFIPGSNLKGEVAGSNWIFLLPSLVLNHVVIIGFPPISTLITLSRLSQCVTVVCEDIEACKNFRGRAKQYQDMGVQAIIADGMSTLPILEGSAQLVLINEGNGIWRLSGDRRRLCEIQRVLTREGLIFIEFKGLVDRVLKRRGVNNLVNIFGEVNLYWLTPFWGEIHTAIPADDGKVTEYFLDNELYSPSVSVGIFKEVNKLLKRIRSSLNRRELTRQPEAIQNLKNPEKNFSIMHDVGLSAVRAGKNIEKFFLRNNRSSRRYGAFVGSSSANLSDTPPAYLKEIARKYDLDIDDYIWGLSAKGEYSSRKVLFFLFDTRKEGRASPKAVYIVKMVRDHIFNPRLENEYNALIHLEEIGFGVGETVPKVVFFGHHSELAVIGETIIEGVFFRQKTEWSDVCPYASSAIDWFIELGAATSNQDGATPKEEAVILDRLLERFNEIYRLSAEHYKFMVEQIERVRDSRSPFPLVFQHGDPGTWNVLAKPNKRVAFIDWEAAELRGVPLWDLLYFMRSYCVGAARAQGTRGRLIGFREQFLDRSKISQLVVEATRRYCQQTGLSGDMVEPLFYTCWMHRALKESTRLNPINLENGHYVNLLRLCIDQRDSPTLTRIFS